MTEVNIKPEVKQKAESTETTLQKAVDYVIESPEQYENATEFLKSVKRELKELEGHRTNITGPINESLKRINDFFRAPKDRLAKAEAALKRGIATYVRIQEEAARKRQIEEQERARKEEERKRAQLEQRAKNWESKGRDEKADALRQEAELVQVQPQVVTPAAPKAQGISTSKRWKHRITDINKLPREHMIPDDKKLARLAEASKGSIQVPGVEFYTEDVVSVRA